jgi:uncharacterized protein with PIN domain
MDEVEYISTTPISIKDRLRGVFKRRLKRSSPEKQIDNDIRVARKLHKVNESDIDCLNEQVGTEAVNFLREEAGEENIFYYTYGQGDGHYAVINHGKVLLIHFYPKTDKSTPLVLLGFCNPDSFDRMLAGGTSEGVSYFSEVSSKLQEGTLNFLRFGGEFLRKIDKDKNVILSPTSKRRERIYKSFIEKNGLTNVHLEESKDDDLKGHKHKQGE